MFYFLHELKQRGSDVTGRHYNTLQKWTNGKAFNIMASAQFFAT